MNQEPLLVAVMGSTASGKTALAEALADSLEAQLINADAFQVYRGFDIGTAKSPRKAEYELIDIKEPDEAFGLGEWLLKTTEVLQRLWLDGRSAIVVGGTGLYIRALFQEYAEVAPAPDEALRRELMDRERAEGLEVLSAELVARDPTAAARVDLNNPVRVRRALERLQGGLGQRVEVPPFRKVKLGLLPPAEVVDPLISQRVEEMFEDGWVEELERLMKSGVAKDVPAMRAHGYRAIYDTLLSGSDDWQPVKDGIALEVRQYAKRQRTWLRKEPELRVLQNWSDTAAAFEEAISVLKEETS